MLQNSSYSTEATPAYILRKSQQLIHESVMHCVKLREEPLRIWTSYKEKYGEWNMVDLQC